MQTPTAQHVQNVLDRLQKVKWNGQSGTALCPGHPDTRQSLQLRVIPANGGLSVKCYSGCSYEHILSSLGLQSRDLYPPKDPQSTSQNPKYIEATYRYLDESGELVKEVRRYRNRETGAKDFIQVRYDEQGREIWSMAGCEYHLAGFGWTRDASKAPVGAERRTFPPCPNVLYNLPAVLSTAKTGGMVLNPEGEKDADNLNRLDLAATTNAQGAKAPWLASYTESLRGVSLAVILADNDLDGGGLHFAESKASALHSAGIAVKVLKFEQKDVSDYLAAGGTKEELLALIEQAPFWTPPPFPTYETEAEWIAAGKSAVQEFDRATALKTSTTIDLGKWMASLVRERGFEYGNKMKTARATLGARLSSARRGETVVRAFHEAGVLSGAKFNRPFDLYLNIAKAPVAKRAAYLQRVETYEKRLTASAIAEELRAAGDLPPKKALNSEEASPWACLESRGISDRVAHEIARLSDEKGEPAINALLERSLGLRSNDVRYTDLPGSALKEEDLPPGEDDYDNLPHILYMQQEIRNLKQQLSNAKIRNYADEEEIAELRKNNQVLADLLRETLPYVPAPDRSRVLDKFNASLAPVSMDLDMERWTDDEADFAQVEQSEDALQGSVSDTSITNSNLSDFAQVEQSEDVTPAPNHDPYAEEMQPICDACPVPVKMEVVPDMSVAVVCAPDPDLSEFAELVAEARADRLPHASIPLYPHVTITNPNLAVLHAVADVGKRAGALEELRTLAAWRAAVLFPLIDSHF